MKKLLLNSGNMSHLLKIKRMKIIALPLLIMIMSTVSLVQAQNNNNFYDDEETHFLAGPATIEVAGEVEAPGKVEL